MFTRVVPMFRPKPSKPPSTILVRTVRTASPDGSDCESERFGLFPYSGSAGVLAGS